MAARETFFHFLDAPYLYRGALIFVILTAVLVGMIHLFLNLKKRRFRVIDHLNEVLNDWISDSLVNNTGALVEIPARILPHIKKTAFRQHVIDSLIVVKKNITGKEGDAIIRLYERLGLQYDAMRKLHSPRWFKKAKGIYELYMMGQRAMLSEIMGYTNHRHVFVRREAQIAVVGFGGFDGLQFLDTLSQPLLEWQQLALLNQLRPLDPQPMPHLRRWIQADNLHVVQFALKLTEIYQQFGLYETVLGCLESDHEFIRFQAINTLGKIPQDGTPQLLMAQYVHETSANKQHILRQLGEIGELTDPHFWHAVLGDDDASLMLEAGRALTRSGIEGWSLLEATLEGSQTLDLIRRQLRQEYQR